MTLPVSGSLSISQINTELTHASTAQINFSSARTLFGVASGPISFTNGRGKSAAPAVTWTVRTGLNASMTDANWVITSTANAFLLAAATANYSVQSVVSTDGGSTWVYHPMPTPGQWGSIVGGGSSFVVNGYPSGCYTLNNGATWTTISSASLPASTKVGYVNNQFVAFENYYGNVHTFRSPTGAVWTQYAATGGPASSRAIGVWTGSKYFYMSDGYTNVGYTSTDLATWSGAITISASGLGSSAYGQIASNGAGTIIVFFSTWGSYTVCVSIDHGSTWQEVILPTGNSSGGGLYQAGIAYGNGTFVIAANNNIFTSPNGLSWSVSSPTGQWGSAAYGSGKWIVADLGGSIAISN